jgi:hypothetical protein
MCGQGLDLAGRTLVGVRVFCRQPSPLWATCELHSLQLFRHETPHADADKGVETSRAASSHFALPKTGRGEAEQGKTREQAASAAREDCLEQPHASNVDGQAVRCLDLVLRLRQVLARPAASPF